MYETVQDLRGITKYQYDLMDRLVKVENPDGSWIEYSYDRVGNKTSVKTTNGKTTYEYDALNRLVKVTDALGNETMYTYDSVGNRKSIINANDTITEYEYDKLNRLVGLVNKNTSGDILSSYKYELGQLETELKLLKMTEEWLSMFTMTCTVLLLKQ